MSAFGINGKPSKHNLALLFMSHPPLDDRIEALKKMTNF
jgi:heat shock protein HtpX